jgi:hypothetical protein
MVQKEQCWYKGGAIQLTPLFGNSFGLSEANGKIIELSQYTGLKDKNGVEIFDGDLCRHKNEYTDIVTQVKWLPKSAGWNIDNRYLSDTEVIGNIYSNPNLLETK